MEIKVKTFEQLPLQILYDVLALRAEVFVIEQNCIYQDIDKKDSEALHILGFYKNELIAYARCFAPGIYGKEAAIGRVLVKKEFRKKERGHEILKAAIKAVHRYYNTSIIKVSAQEHLMKFYKSHGFQPKGKGYLEDGIPHIAMIKNG